MTKERIINGVIYEFDDNTPETVIRRFEAQKTSGAPATPGVAPVGRPRPQAFSTGLGSQALQGLTLGFSDEAIAGLRAAMGQGEYADLVKAEREGLRKYGEQHPVASTVAQLTGSIAPAIATGGLGLVPGLSRTVATRLGPRAADLLFGSAPTVGRMAGTGAVTGGIEAVGTSEKPLSELPVEGVKGTVVGGTAAGSVGLFGKYIAAPAFRSLKQSLGFGDANKAADLAIAKALQKDGLTPEQAATKMAAVQRGEMTLADLGENTAKLLRTATAAPGEARRMAKTELVGREMERVPRTAEDLRTLMSGSKDFFTDVQDLIKKRSTEADALYDAAWQSAPVFGPKTAPDIERLRNLPSFNQAMKAGMRRMEDKGLDITDPKNTLRGLHETKIALDDMIETAMRGGETNQAKTLISMKERLLKDMEQASPEYRTARQAFAGDSELLTAMNEGRNIYKMPEMDMRKLIDRFKDSPSEYDAFRAGISQAMLERLTAGGPSADPFKTVFPKGVEDKIRRAFRDDDAFEIFKTRLGEEQRMLQTEKTGFRKTPVDTDLEGPAGGVGAATTLLQGRPIAAGMEALRAKFPNLIGMPPAVAAPVTERLLTPAGKVDTVMDNIMSSLKAQEADLLKMSGAVGMGGSLIGGLAAARPVKQQYPEETLNRPGLQPPGQGVPMAPPMGPGASPLGSLAQ